MTRCETLNHKMTYRESDVIPQISRVWYKFTVSLIDTKNFVYVAGFLSLNGKMTFVVSIFIVTLALCSFKSIWSESNKDYYIVCGFGQFVAITLVLHLIFVIVNYQHYGQEVKVIRDLYTYDLSDPIWNKMQEKYQCCGIEGYKDWYTVPFGMSKITPDQCCIDYFPGCGRKNVPIHQQGCKKKIIGVIERYIYAIIGLTTISITASVFNSVMAYKFTEKIDNDFK